MCYILRSREAAEHLSVGRLREGYLPAGHLAAFFEAIYIYIYSLNHIPLKKLSGVVQCQMRN